MGCGGLTLPKKSSCFTSNQVLLAVIMTKETALRREHVSVRQGSEGYIAQQNLGRQQNNCYHM